MPDSEQRAIFRRGSRTYFNSSRFFPRSIRDDVVILYAFVRAADNFVDANPQQEEAFHRFREVYRRTLKGETSGDPAVDSFVELISRKNIAANWVTAFLDSMEMDLYRRTYATLAETEAYIHGSAEVIGFMMASIMELKKEAFESAGLLGKAMQYINFIRDIDEDSRLGRTYFPETDLSKHGLDSLNRDACLRKPESFSAFVRDQLERYIGWQILAERGFRFLSRSCLVPIKTASDMYKWTAKRIAKDPLIVYRTKIKPSRPRIFWKAARNYLYVINLDYSRV
jgi:phytoene synthase